MKNNLRKYMSVLICVCVLLFFASCKKNTEKYTPGTRVEGELDEFLVTHPIDALLDDIYGLDTKLTTGEITDVRKYFNPLEEQLTYEITYDKSDGEENFVGNVKKHFAMEVNKTEDKQYEGSHMQYDISISFLPLDQVFFVVRISEVDMSTVFPFIDNEYPDDLIPRLPQGLSVFTAIRGLNYSKESNSLSFVRDWVADSEFANEFIDYYTGVWETHEKTQDVKTGYQEVSSNLKNNVKGVASSLRIDDNETSIRFEIVYDLNKTGGL